MPYREISGSQNERHVDINAKITGADIILCIFLPTSQHILP